jgi:hypothetical protein
MSSIFFKDFFHIARPSIDPVLFYNTHIEIIDKLLKASTGVNLSEEALRRDIELTKIADKILTPPSLTELLAEFLETDTQTIAELATYSAKIDFVGDGNHADFYACETVQ